MNREIKFRAWNEPYKKMSEGCDFIDLLIYSNNWFGARIKFSSNYYPVCDCKIMQYTGLKDKNGKEVYEDDIVKVPIGKKPVFHIGAVVYEGCGFIVNLSGSDWYELTGCEVIGNIFENQDLLK